MGKFIPVAAGQACPAVLKAERAEGGAKRSAACSAVRCFLVSQCIFELLAVAIRHPSSDRLLQIFCALVVRLLRGGLGAGGPQQAAAAALAPALAEQLLCQLRLADASAQALAAASAALSPCLPLEAFSPVLPALLAKLGANCAEAFKALMASLALSAKKHNELDLNSFVPRLLSLMPLEPPKALLRSALRPGGLQRVRAAVPLAAAMAAVGQKPMEPENWEVEENISFQRTFGTFPRAGDTAETSPAEKAAAPALRCQRLQGLAMLGQLEMAESPNAANFQERPQWRVEILDDHSELFLSLSLLPVSRCFSPAYAVDPGQLGFWICEFPEASDEEKNCHQLDLRPPVHVSATPGCEHLVSVALPRGLYTVVPFSSHVVLDTGAERARQLCRSQRCGCVDANLVQPALWDLGSRFAAISMWAESTDLSICQASPWYQRLRIDWSLLTQSLPIWLRSNSPEPLEVLICVTGEDDQALLGTEPCLDLWPELPHRRVRNERTGALRVHVAKLAAMSSLRVSCVWQER
ncbi:unnamed protein product [Effrenium voratum]|nr:unnamed protein product [Effrenium voratum]